MLKFESQALKQKMSQVFHEKGLNRVSATHAVESMIQTSLRGVDSHGINLFPHYCRAIESGRISSNPNIIIKKTAPSTAYINADHAFGHHSGAVAIDYAVELALETGIAAVSVRNSTHFGAASYFALRAAEKGFIGFSFTNADALVKAHASKVAFFGTNPVCMAAPLLSEDPFCLDMATSIVSWNKIQNYKRENKEVPEGWVYDQDGLMTNDPSQAKSLHPAGDYKGFGLGMLVDILCATLGGGLISKDLLPMYNSPIGAKRKISHFFMAINIEKFIRLNTFKENLQTMVDRIRALPQLELAQPVLVPGDPEKINYKDRIKNGIPVDEIKYQEFLSVSKDFSEAIL